jgi:XTP/dITP diphosphohydrolase
LTRLVLATGNPHKVREIEPLLAGAGVDLVAVGSLVDGWEVEETGDTLMANAALKARAAVRATGDPAVADDTGLFVDALAGAPGVTSSRYAGPDCSYEDNVRKLLRAMEGEADRAARFRTVVVLSCPDGSERAFEGSLEGTIGTSTRGTNGFGYDPAFVLPDARTLAELPLAEKNRTSHRAVAFGALADWLRAGTGEPICPCRRGME